MHAYTLPSLAIVLDFEDSLNRFIKEVESGANVQPLNLARQLMSAQEGKENDVNSSQVDQVGSNVAAPNAQNK